MVRVTRKYEKCVWDFVDNSMSLCDVEMNQNLCITF